MYVNSYIILFRHNRYTGSRDTINITHNQTLIRYEKNVLNRLRLEGVKQGIRMHVCRQVFSVVTDKYVLNRLVVILCMENALK